VQLPHGLSSSVPDCVSHAQKARGAAIDRHKQHGLALGPETLGTCGQFPEDNFLAVHQHAIASTTLLPSTLPVTPCPVIDANSSVLVKCIPRVAAPVTIAAASGCSLARSRLAAKRNSSISSHSFAVKTLTSFGFPSVSVPVLSTTNVSTLRRTSSASAF